MNITEQKWFRALALHLPEEVYEQVSKEADVWIEQKIKEVCDKQKEICLKSFSEEWAKDHNQGRSYFDATEIINNSILNAPYPEGVE